MFFPSDYNGTGQWRGIWPIETIWALGQAFQTKINIIDRVILDQNFYQNINMFMVQRLVNDAQMHFFNNLICTCSQNFRFWTIYNIDDAMHYKDIVRYNRGYKGFKDEKSQENIKKMLNSADFVLTTTDYIKDYYHRRYDVPLENIIAIPNYLPRWLYGNKFIKDLSLKNFKDFKNKPRIGVVGSISHYNIENRYEDENGNIVEKIEVEENGQKKIVWKDLDGNEVEAKDYKWINDDLDIILDCIKETVDDFRWVFFGYRPERLAEYFDSGKIEYHPGVPILEYQNMMQNLRLNAIVAPLQDGEFNRCKSNIKWLEACAFGIPLFAQNISTYSKYMPQQQLFNNSADLKEKLLKLKFSSGGVYESIITNQYKFLISPHKECGINSPSWWLEDNLKPWLELFRMKKKYNVMSFDRYLKKLKEDEAKNNIIYADDANGLEIIK